MPLRAWLMITFGAVLALALPSAEPASAQFVRTWTGAGATQLFSTPTNWSGNTAPVDGDIVFFQGSGGNVTAFNDFADLSLTRIQFNGSGTFTLLGNNLEVSDALNVDGSVAVQLNVGLTGPGGGTVGPFASLTQDSNFSGTLDTFGQLTVRTAMGLGSPVGLTRVQNGGTLFVDAAIDLGEEPIFVQGDGGGLRAAALIATGEPVTIGNLHVVLETTIEVEDLRLPNGIRQDFPGFDLTINGDVVVSGNTSAEGPIRVGSGGRLTWNSDADVDISLAPGAFLQGSGRVSSVVSEGGAVFPVTDAGVSRLTVTGAVDLAQANSGLLALLNGPIAGTDYSQLRAGGPISIRDGATFDVLLAFNFEPEVGQAYRIVDNTGAGPIDGTFFGYPEGEVFEIEDGYFGEITYVGGDGNDVVVEIVEPPAEDPRPYKLGLPMVSRDG